jgi:hypothetical protein
MSGLMPANVNGDGPVLIEVVTTSGQKVTVEFRIRSDTVEVWHHRQRIGVFRRETLRGWLAEPWRPLVVGEVVFSLDRMVDCRGRVALSLPDVMAWTLAPNALDALIRRI